jgi:hypothetical protein
MRRTLIALAATPALVLAAAGTAAAAPAVHHPGVIRNATPACGLDCINLFSEQTGPGQIESVYVPGSNGQAHSAKAGDRIDLKAGNLTYTNEDFSATVDENVGQACSDGDLAARSYTCLHFATETAPGVYTGAGPVYELNWSPDGDQSGMCAGLATAGTAGESVTLEPCGASALTLWAGDDADAHQVGAYFYEPFVNGSDGSSTMPLVLQVNTGSKGPSNRLVVQREALFNAFVPNQDMFTGYPGVAF